MDYAAARAELELLVQADAEPTLSGADVDVLLDLARRPDSAGNPPANVTTAAAWASAHAYQVGDVIYAASRWWRCAIAGTSDTTVPSWPDLGGSAVTAARVVDGDVVWSDNGGEWNPTWDLRAAARHGWLVKAGKVAGNFGFVTDQQTFNRDQVHAHCLAMAREYAPRGMRTVGRA